MRLVPSRRGCQCKRAGIPRRVASFFDGRRRSDFGVPIRERLVPGLHQYSVTSILMSVIARSGATADKQRPRNRRLL
jgi:hypothetical protein